MITTEMRNEAITYLTEHWGVETANRIVGAGLAEKIEMPMKDFLNNCTACGGNWGGMLLTGIKELFPTVWALIPDDMGCFAWQCLCYTLMLCGVDTSQD